MSEDRRLGDHLVPQITSSAAGTTFSTNCLNGTHNPFAQIATTIAQMSFLARKKAKCVNDTCEDSKKRGHIPGISGGRTGCRSNLRYTIYQCPAADGEAVNIWKGLRPVSSSGHNPMMLKQSLLLYSVD